LLIASSDWKNRLPRNEITTDEHTLLLPRRGHRQGLFIRG
jgi:hypothetical protein